MIRKITDIPIGYWIVIYLAAFGVINAHFSDRFAYFDEGPGIFDYIVGIWAAGVCYGFGYAIERGLSEIRYSDNPSINIFSVFLFATFFEIAILVFLVFR